MVRKCFDNLEKHIKQEKEMDELAQDTREFLKFCKGDIYRHAYWYTVQCT